MLLIKQNFKSLKKYPTSTVLTLVSLLIAFLGVIIITYYVSFEKSYDRFHKNADDIYRLETLEYGPWVPAIAGNIIKEQVPEIETLVPFNFNGGKISTPKQAESNISFKAEGIFAGAGFFKMFSFPLVSGNANNALNEPNTIVLTQGLAEKIFGKTNPLGETIIFQGESYNITGIMEDFPKNSSFKADCIPSFATLMKDGRNGVNEWSEWSFNIWVKLQNQADPLQIASKIDNIPSFNEQLSTMKERYPNQVFIVLNSIKKIHFIPDGNYIYANPLMLKVLTLLAAILALMGAVNFINFSTSQAPFRNKPLGMLRVLGGNRFSVMMQLVIESIFLTMVALIIAFVIYALINKNIEAIFDINGLALSNRYTLLAWFALFALLFGALTGLYPARYITSPSIVQSIKGNAYFTGKGKVFRSALVVMQFVFTIMLMVSAFTIEKQLTYWRNYDIGIDKEHVVYLSTTDDIRKHYQAFADELLQNENIKNYCYTQFKPGAVGMGWGRMVDGQYIQLKCWPVDDNFIDFFGIKMAQGRPFMKNSEADLNTFILNESAVAKFGWEKPLEKVMSGFNFQGPIIGVAKNFNFSSLKEEVEPMQLWLTNGRKNTMLLRLNPGNTSQTIAHIKNVAHNFDQKNKIDVEFLDDSLNQLYTKEEKTARFIEFIAVWCMMLALTGILGLVIFISRDRIKEIGIRKVNGAKVFEILALLNKDFINWVVLALIIACPLAYLAMNKWLESFAYKTTLNWWIFALAGTVALGIALLTVSLQTYRAATRNPVEALRYE